MLCILKDVLYVEGLAKNLISLAKVALSGLTAVFANDKCVISNANSQLVATRDHRNLYVAEATSVDALGVESAASIDASGHDVTIWNQSFGHLKSRGTIEALITPRHCDTE